MKTAILDYTTLTDHHALWLDFHRLRYRLFVEGKAWNVSGGGGFESDQYDNFNAVYVLVGDGDRCLGGARLTPSMAENGQFSYMIRDAWLGMLPGFPREIMVEEPPRAPHVWEVSRYTLRPEVMMDRRGAEVRQRIYDGCYQICQDNAVTEALVIMPEPFLRRFQREHKADVTPEPVSVVTSDQGKICVGHIHVPLKQPARLPLTAC